MTTPNPLTAELIRDFIIAAHGNLPRVREMLIKVPELLNVRHQWAENDSETAIQAAAQVGSGPVAEYLLAHGAPLEICTAAMLGRKDEVARMLDEDPALINATGAHGIPLMPHAALSNNLELAKMLHKRGADRSLPLALANAVMKGHVKMARWLMEISQPDFTWKNFEGKTLLTIAGETRNEEMLTMLREHGAK
jgi:ankyrin repeat protein